MENTDLKWFASADLTKHKGEYVIILDNKVIFYGKNLNDILKQFREKYPDEVPKIAKIPEENLLVVW